MKMRYRNEIYLMSVYTPPSTPTATPSATPNASPAMPRKPRRLTRSNSDSGYSDNGGQQLFQQQQQQLQQKLLQQQMIEQSQRLDRSRAKGASSSLSNKETKAAASGNHKQRVESQSQPVITHTQQVFCEKNYFV